MPTTHIYIHIIVASTHRCNFNTAQNTCSPPDIINIKKKEKQLTCIINYNDGDQKNSIPVNHDRV